MKTLLEFMNRDRLRKYKLTKSDSTLLAEICQDPNSIKYIVKNAHCDVTVAQHALTYLECCIEDLENKAKKEKESFYNTVVWFIATSYTNSLVDHLENEHGIFLKFPLACDISLAILDLIE